MIVKPCPFCGWNPLLEPDDFIYPNRDGWEVNCYEYFDSDGNHIAGGCGVTMFANTKEEALDKWNRREDK